MSIMPTGIEGVNQVALDHIQEKSAHTVSQQRKVFGIFLGVRRCDIGLEASSGNVVRMPLSPVFPLKRRPALQDQKQQAPYHVDQGLFVWPPMIRQHPSRACIKTKKPVARAAGFL
jgi:hypothetical protein